MAPMSKILSSKREGTSTAPLSNKKPRHPETSPVSVVQSIIGEEESGFLSVKVPVSFQKPTEEEIEAYDLEIVRAIRNGDLPKLKELHAAGKNLNASNQFGESLLHMACRRGNVEILSYMLKEANVRVDRRDDFGRNILHDACWTSNPNFEIMDALIEVVDPSLLLSQDVRGSTPFDYCRRDHWADWTSYLSKRKEKLEMRIRQLQHEASTNDDS